jgi:hypothetical protein
MIPTVHLNGTSKDELLDQIVKAAHAIREAQRWLGAAGPNGRDYYVQGEGAHAAACAERNAWQADLRRIYDGLLAVHDGIEEQGGRP